jgi:hypothetical protein
MANTKPPVFETAEVAWGDAFRAIGAMPVMAGIAFVLILVTSLATYALVDSLWLPVVSIGASIVQAALLAPLAIAVHRFVLLGERTNGYPLDPGSSRYLRFVGFAILVKILWLIPSMIQLFIPRVRDIPGLPAALSIASIVLLIAVIIIVVRRVILFPAIAIDAPGATWSRAGLDTKGSSWSVAFIFILTVLPVLVIGGILYTILLLTLARSSVGSLLTLSVLGAVVGVPTLCAFAAAASHIYRARADVMTQSSG